MVSTTYGDLGVMSYDIVLPCFTHMGLSENRAYSQL